MKKKYIRPVMENEMFVANEYVAACAILTLENLKCTSTRLFACNKSIEGPVPYSIVNDIDDYNVYLSNLNQNNDSFWLGLSHHLGGSEYFQSTFPGDLTNYEVLDTDSRYFELDYYTSTAAPGECVHYIQGTLHSEQSNAS